MASPTDSFTIVQRNSGNAPAGLISKTKYSIAALTAANFAAQNTKVSALQTAQGPLSSAVISSADISINLGGSPIYPTGIANRGSKWIISAANTNGRKFTYTISAPVETGNLQADNSTADLASTAWAAYVTAFNAVAVDPAANALTIVGARLGGRRR